MCMGNLYVGTYAVIHYAYLMDVSHFLSMILII